MARLTRFERVTSAFGGGYRSSLCFEFEGNAIEKT
jgi:hypothetical protein